MLINMLPCSSVYYRFDGGPVQPEHLPEFSVRCVTISGKCANFSYVVFAKFGEMLEYAFRCASMKVSMPHIFFSGGPDQIIKSVVVSRSVQMTSIRAVWARTNKSFKNFYVNFKDFKFTFRSSGRKSWVAVLNAIAKNARSFANCLAVRPEIGPNSSKSGDLVHRKSRDFFPNLFHSLPITHSKNEPQGNLFADIYCKLNWLQAAKIVIGE